MKKLVTQETIKAYMNRFKKMTEMGFSKQGDDLFIEKLIANSEQVENLHVITKINGFQVECDEPKALGGSNTAPRPIDLLLASLANCLEISALLYFSFSPLKINNVKVSVETEIDKRAILPDKNAPLPGFNKFLIKWDITTEENETRVKNIIDKVERFCPIVGTLARSQDFQWIINISK